MINCLNKFVFAAIITAGFISPAFAEILAIAQNNEKYASIVVDENTNQVLYQVAAEEKRYPASLTKLMTLYLTFDSLKKGELKKGDLRRVSAHAASEPPTSLGLDEGELISIEDCVAALVVRSANDCSVVLAEAMATTEYFFSYKMTKMAEKLGMVSTRFSNSHGLPDKRNFTTAADLAKLAIALKRDFPEYYNYFSGTKFFYRGKEITSHNNITKCYEGATGLKTGFINDSGFNLASTVSRGDKNILAIVMGGRNPLERDRHMVEILNMYFAPQTDSPWANIKPVKQEFADACDRLGIVKNK